MNMTEITLEYRPPISRRDSAPRLLRFMSPYTGIVNSAHELTNAPDDARLITIGCESADIGVIHGGTSKRVIGSAADTTRDRALASAIGEVVERYCGGVPLKDPILASARELEGAVNPADFALFDPMQYARKGFPFKPFTEDTRIHWSEVYDLTSRALAYAPTQLVYLCEPSPNDTRIGYATSSGMAAGATLEQSILTGLLELVERDAFMLAWYSHLSLPLLDWSHNADLVAEEQEYYAPTGLTYRAVDMSMFLDVPTVAVVIYGQGCDPVGISVGAASGTTIEEAWRKAIREAFQTRVWAKKMRLANPEKKYRPDYEDIETFDDHVLFFANSENAPLAEFLTGSREVRNIQDIEPIEGDTPLAQAEAIAARIQRRGFKTYFADLTSEDVGGNGIFVSKAICPQMAQLDVAHVYRFLGGSRLFHAAFDLGLVPAPLDSQTINCVPHPFP